MEFLYPGFLYALIALSIPVIVHLFNFRRFKKIAFTNVRFLREVQSRTRSQNRLRHLLVLLARLLALAFLIFAFAQPFIPTGANSEAERNRAISIFVDNSFSMEGETEEGPLLEVAKNRAIDIAMAFRPTDRFQVLTQDFEGAHQHLISRSEFIDYVQDIDYSPHSRSFEEITTRQADMLHRSDAGNELRSYIVSDFQKSRYDLTASTPDTSIALSLVYLQRTSPANLYVDSVWFANPVRKAGQAEKLVVRVVNTGDERVDNVPLQLTINGVQRAIGSIAINAGAMADTVLHFIHEIPGLKNAQVNVDDYPVTYDDTYYFGYSVFESINVLAIRPEHDVKIDYLRGVFVGDSAYRYESSALSNLDYSAIPSRDFVILDGLKTIPGGLGAKLEELLDNGGSVWIIPADEIDESSYNSFLVSIGAGSILGKVKGSNEVNRINAESPIYSGIFESIPRNPDLPKMTEYYRISPPADGTGDALLTMRGGDTFLESYERGGGRAYLLAVSLDPDKNNFSRHGLFVATALRMAELSRATAIYSFELGEGKTLSLPVTASGSEPIFHLVSTDGSIDVIPYHRTQRGRTEISPGPDLEKAGGYFLISESDTSAALGLNYSRRESQLASYTRDELVETVQRLPGMEVSIIDGNTERLTSEVERLRSGTELWKYCLILALIFLLTETLLLRIGKKQGA